MKTPREILIDYVSDLHPDMPTQQVIHGVNNLIKLANKPSKSKQHVHISNNNRQPVDSISGVEILDRLPTVQI